MNQRVDTLRNVEAPEGVELGLRVAGPYPRALAYLIDVLIRQVVYGIVGGLLALLGGVGVGILLVLVFACEWFYPVLFEVRYGGATPGKRALGLQVLRDDGTPVGVSESLLRNLLIAVDLLPVGGVFGLLSCVTQRDFKRLGDRVAGTLVVHVDEHIRTPRLAAADPIPPPVALHLEEQAALIEFSVRAPSWTRERAIEVGDHLAAVSGASGADGVRKLLGMARWIEGER